jgi:alpha-tubulin suppressor-like RCC1 family protein
VISALGQRVQVIQAGKESSYFLFDDGSVGACGRNDGELYDVPLVFVRFLHCMLTLFLCARYPANEEGQLGDGSFVDKEKTSVEIPNDDIIYGLGSGASSQSVFFIAKDTVYAAGTNDRYQLGIGEVGSKADPVEVKFNIFTNMDIVKISSSGSHTVAIEETDGSIVSK